MPIERRPALSSAILALATAAALVLTAVSTASGAEDDAYLKYRQKVMSAVGANMGAIGDILKNGLPFTGNIESHAGALADAAKLIGPAFEHKVVDGPTDAQPKIWEDWAKFEKSIAAFEKAARDLQQAAGAGDMATVGANMKLLGRSCGGCHRPFRKPKEESYKRR